MEAAVTLVSFFGPLSAFSGWVVVVESLSDALLWPLSKTMCRSNQKMTTYKGCADKSALSPGPGGYLFASVCCVLSLCAAGLFIDPMAPSALCASSCVLSMLVGYQNPQRLA
jgi:hypothetical protein